MPRVDNMYITDSELQTFLTDETQAGKAKALLAEQKTVWELLRKGYESLDSVETRTFDFDGFQIKIQFNPGRIVSSSAKVDDKSIKERKCFLCPKNLPPEQRGISAEGDYVILCNPFPIFTEHFTIPNIEHTAQDIKSSFGKFLAFARDLGKFYTVFYNGPKCGASAPDHLHFQAGSKYFMPLDSEYDSIKTRLGNIIVDKADLKVYAVDGYPGKFFSFESKNNSALEEAFDRFYDLLKEKSLSEEEPMMNLIGSYENDTWRVMVFPRAKHRPSYYFAEGDENILLSPASVDMGGVLITPLEKDFKKITKENILDIFNQVSYQAEDFALIKDKLAEKL
ncbi:MAG: DUF4922 domain-containing protein [Bacillota bacterium]